ncbi:unnamed protein product [Camellia sinensis]
MVFGYEDAEEMSCHGDVQSWRCLGRCRGACTEEEQVAGGRWSSVGLGSSCRCLNFELLISWVFSSGSVGVGLVF